MLAKRHTIVLYCLILLVNVLSNMFSWKIGILVSKTLLMPILVYLILQAKKNTSEINWRVIMAGLFFAWAGDVLLLFSGIHEYFFLLGLVFFLCCHVAYILYFNRYNPRTTSWAGKNPLLALLPIVFAISIFCLLQPNLQSLTIPVGIYIIVITLMAIKALSIKYYVPRPQCYRYFVAGVLLFLLSDTLLAINKFVGFFPASNAFVMLSYGIAQLMIVEGALKNQDHALKAINI